MGILVLLLSDTGTCIATSQPEDWCLIIDTSNSINNDELEVLFNALEQFAGQLNVGTEDGQVLVAAVTFGGMAECPFSFKDHTDTPSLVAAMRRLRRVDVSRGTRTDRALRKCCRLFENDGRDDVERNILVFTDGRSTARNRLSMALAEVESKNITVYSVGIGDGIDQPELLSIALGNPNNVFLSATFETLVNLTSTIIAGLQTCGEYLTY